MESPHRHSRMAMLLSESESDRFVDRDADTLPDHLGEVAEEYPNIGLPNFVPGILMYRAMSIAVLEAIEKGDIEHGQKMRTNMMVFADQQRKATHNFVHGDMENLGVWKSMHLVKDPERGHAAIHADEFYTNHTLPDLADTQLLTDTIPEIHEEDYYKIDPIIEKVGFEVMDDIIDMREIFRKMKIPEAVLMIMIRRVKQNRRTAMEGYKKVYAVKKAGKDWGPVHAEVMADLHRRAERRKIGSSGLAHFGAKVLARSPNNFRKNQSGIYVPETVSTTEASPSPITPFTQPEGDI